MKKDTRTVLEFIIVFIAIVSIECADIQLKLDNRRIIKKDKIVGHALVVSENKITEYVANAQIVNGTSAIVANAVVTKEDIEKAKNEKKEEPVEVPQSNGVATSGWAWPTQPGWNISSNYGYRFDPFTGSYDFHGALDIYGPGHGSAIYAANNGTIYTKGWTRSYGNYYIINHNNGYFTLYAHMSGFVDGIEVGTNVYKGQHIGYMGMTGSATGPHLHFESWVGIPWGGGYMVNPWTLY